MNASSKQPRSASAAARAARRGVRSLVLATAVLAAMLVAAASASAQVPTSSGTQLPGSGFANAVAIDGSTAMQGNGCNTGVCVPVVGTVDIFQKGTSGWSKVQTLSPPSGDTDPGFFGDAIGLDKGAVETAAIDSGNAVYVYTANKALTRWSLAQQINRPADDSGSPGHFGCCAAGFFENAMKGVSLNGSTLAIGDSTDSSGAGAVWIYTLSKGTWSETKELDGPASSTFGDAVDVKGSELLVGANNGGGFGARGGAAYVYRGSGSNWSQQAALSSPNPFASGFGQSVGIDGSSAVVGEGIIPCSTFCGDAWVFQFNGATWSSVAQLTDQAGFQDQNPDFGTSAAIDATSGRIVIGAFSDFSPWAAYVFASPAPGVWHPDEELVPHTAPTCGGASACSFGLSVGVSGTTEIVNGGEENSSVYP